MLIQQVVSETIRAPDQSRGSLTGASFTESRDARSPPAFINVQESCKKFRYTSPTVECDGDDAIA